MEYIRCRRLAYAVVDLVQGKRIIDIALEYGFETHNGFGKAFRKVYGCSPERYRLHGSGQIPLRVDLSLLVQYDLRGAIVMEPQIVTKPAFKIAGYELKTTTRDGLSNREIPAFWGNVERLSFLHNQLHCVGAAELGMCFPADPVTGNFSYIIAVEVSDFAGVPADMYTAEVPEAVYAVFTTPANDGEENIGPAIEGSWSYIHQTWLPNSGYEIAEGKSDFEWYPCSDKPGEKVKIYIPVVKTHRSA